MSLDEQRANYFAWLVSQVSGDEYLILLKLMHDTEFYTSVGRDYNYETKAKDLRVTWFKENCNPDEHFALDGCATVLEVLLVFAMEMDYMLWNPEYGDRTAQWFWELVGNLGLADMSDDRYFERGGTYRVTDTLQEFIGREYDHDGHGNVFFIDNSDFDFRTTELWYQLNAYVSHNYTEDGLRR